jgi:hypothetical protein
MARASTARFNLDPACFTGKQRPRRIAKNAICAKPAAATGIDSTVPRMGNRQQTLELLLRLS